MTVTVQVERDPIERSIPLEIAKIRILDFSPREHQLSEEHVQELMEDFVDEGQLTPVLVDSNTNGIVDGHHRLEATKRLGWKKIRAIYRKLSEEECHAYALKLNVFTKTLTPIEEANKIKILIEKYNWSTEKVGHWFRGKSKTWVSFRMRLAKVARPVQIRIQNENSNLTPSHAIWISDAPTPQMQEELAKYVDENQISVPETQRLVYELKARDWKFKRGLQHELEQQVSPSDADAEVVSAARDYRARNHLAPPLQKTGLIDLSRFHILHDTNPAIKLRFSEHLCRSCGAKVDSCPDCKGTKTISGFEFSWLVPEKTFLTSLVKDQVYINKMLRSEDKARCPEAREQRKSENMKHKEQLHRQREKKCYVMLSLLPRNGKMSTKDAIKAIIETNTGANGYYGAMKRLTNLKNSGFIGKETRTKASGFVWLEDKGRKFLEEHKQEIL